MNRRNFFKITATCTGGLVVLPDFLYKYAVQQNGFKPGNCLVFVQLLGGNDGLNTFIPYKNELYYKYRPVVAINKKEVISGSNEMGFHPALRGFADIQQQGNLTVIQNVGYPEPNRSHFRSQEIWETASSSNEFLSHGWLGRFLDQHYKDHHPVGGVNIDNIDTLALKGEEPNSLTMNNLNFNTKEVVGSSGKLSENPQLDFVRRIAASAINGSEELDRAYKKAPPQEVSYPQSKLAKNLEWIARLIKGDLNTSVYYTSLNGFDTHSRQLSEHTSRLSDLNDAVYAFYKDIKVAGKLDEVTIVVFSEFGRRVQDNGSGTDHGTAAPMFVIGGRNKGTNIGNNPNLTDFDSNGDLMHETDFRSVYASLLQDKFSFNPKLIGISNTPVTGIF